MPSIISSSDLTRLTGVFSDHMDTFATQNLIVFKEPIKTISSPVSSVVYPGYTNASAVTDVTYTPVSGQFKAMVIHNKDQKAGEAEQIRHRLSQGQIRVKINQDARDYILNGRTETVQVNGQSFKVVSDDGVQNFFGLQYYYFTLERVL